jgi:hypothetical protein
MYQEKGMYSNKAPLFKGDDYALWKIRMKIYLMGLGFNVWKYVENGYTAPTNPPIVTTRNQICNDNSREVNAILGGLKNHIFVKIIHSK